MDFQSSNWRISYEPAHLIVVLAGIGYIFRDRIHQLSLDYNKSSAGEEDELNTVNKKPTFFIYNLTTPERNPEFYVNDRIRFAASGKPGQTVMLCYSFRKPTEKATSNCDPVKPDKINQDGTWRLDSQVIGISVGAWQRWVKVGKVTSNKIKYTVVNPQKP